MSATVEAPGNISAPMFIGPISVDGGFYFICRVVYNSSAEVDFDVALTIDGEPLSESVKTISSSASLDAIYSSQDFKKRIFGKTVQYDAEDAL